MLVQLHGQETRRSAWPRTIRVRWMQRFAAGKMLLATGDSAYRGETSRERCRSLVSGREPGVLVALNARLTTNTRSDTTTSNAAVETAAAMSVRA